MNTSLLYLMYLRDLFPCPPSDVCKGLHCSGFVLPWFLLSISSFDSTGPFGPSGERGMSAAFLLLKQISLVKTLAILSHNLDLQMSNYSNTL